MNHLKHLPAPQRYDHDRGMLANVSALAVEIDLLRIENAELRQRYNAMADMQANIATLTAKIYALEAANTLAENHLVHARNRIKEMVKQLEELDVQVEDLRSENRILAGQHASASYDVLSDTWRAQK